MIVVSVRLCWSSLRNWFNPPAHVGYKGSDNEEDSRRDSTAHFTPSGVKDSSARCYDHDAKRSKWNKLRQDARHTGQNEPDPREKFGNPEEKAKPRRKLSV